jgi:hypothetical protein
MYNVVYSTLYYLWIWGHYCMAVTKHFGCDTLLLYTFTKAAELNINVHYCVHTFLSLTIS